MPAIVVDTETTGLPKRTAAGRINVRTIPHLVSVAWLRVDGEKIGPVTRRIIRPDGFRIPASASQVHGITTAQAKAEGVALGEALDELVAAAQGATEFVAHNIEFDVVVLQKAFATAMRPFVIFSLEAVCTMAIGAAAYPREAKAGRYLALGALHELLFGEGVRDAHEAGADALACARCFVELRRRRAEKARAQAELWGRLRS